MKIHVKKLHADAQVPSYKTRGAAGFDLVAIEDVTFQPNEVKLIRTGLAIDVGFGYQLEIRDRSGMALKTPLRVANAPGTIDEDYRGEIGVIMEHANVGPGRDKPYEVKKGDRIAQGVVMAATQADIELVDDLSHTDRGAGGFGSTGK